ncbi:MAG: GDSL-type esterase/lipase family protein [Thermoleophilaceae bacterium]
MTNVRTPEPPKPPREPRRFSARDALIAIGVAALLLVLVEGPSIRNSGERMDDGLWKEVVLAVGKPADQIGDVIPLPELGDELTGWLSPDDDSGGPGSFEAIAQDAATGGRISPITPDYFDPRTIGEDPPAPRDLDTVLVTGDSMSMPLDAEVARKLEGQDIEVLRDPQIGTGISVAEVGDWGSISVRQTREEEPDAVVIFIGANEGFPMPQPGGGTVECCGADWAAVYASRVRRMMDTYRQGGEARVYWLTLPMPRDKDRQEIAQVVNEAIAVGAQPFRVHVRVLDMAELFTPGGDYRDSMEVDGEDRIVRDADGIHLNDRGAELAADAVLDALEGDFGDLSR